MKRFASLTSRLVITLVLLVAVVTLLIAGAATVGLRSYLSGRLDSDVMASLGRFSAHGQGPLAPPGDGDADNHPLDFTRDGALTAASASNRSYGVVTTHGAPQKLDSSQIALVTAVPADGHPHDVDLPGLGEFRVAVTEARISFDGGATSTTGLAASGLPTSSVDGPTSRLIAW